MDQTGLIANTRLSIWLDTYDDIFSDFDPRPYEERALSDDFINEARKMVKEKPGGQVELKLLMPSELRETDAETIIVKSLHRHFNHFALLTKTEMVRIKWKGYLMCTIGFIIMIATAYLGTLTNKMFYINAIQVVLEPSGWFFAWTGFDHVFENARRRKPELIFNLKMAHAEITFLAI